MRDAGGGEGGVSTVPYDLLWQVRDLADKKHPYELKLKLGAQVVLLANKPALGLFNGSRGVVVGFAEVSACECERRGETTRRERP